MCLSNKKSHATKKERGGVGKEREGEVKERDRLGPNLERPQRNWDGMGWERNERIG
jgi:hypothetical protein